MKKKPKRFTPKKYPRQARAVMDVMQTVTNVLGPRTRGIYLILDEHADGSTIRLALRAAHALTAALAERLAAVT